MTTLEFLAGRDVSGINYETIRSLIRWGYVWRFVGFIVSALSAEWVSSTFFFFTNPNLMYVTAATELIILFVLGWNVSKFPTPIVTVLFLIYAALSGITLSQAVYLYTSESITLAFLITASIFGLLIVISFITKIDLTQYRTYLFIALLGLVAAFAVSFLLESSFAGLFISLAGVLIFIVLTAFDVYKLKYLAASPELQADSTKVTKYSVYGALSLYLEVVSFIIFIMRLLRRLYQISTP